MNYQEKYEKYKFKYLQLKEIIGGETNLDKFNKHYAKFQLILKSASKIDENTAIGEIQRIKDLIY